MAETKNTGTLDHPLCNCARDADGNALDPDIRAREEAAAAAAETPSAQEN